MNTKSIIYKLILSIITIFLIQHVKSQTVDIGTYNSNFEYIKDSPITSSYTSLDHKFTITVPMKIEVSFCGSNGLSGYCISNNLSGLSISFAVDMCSSGRIFSKENIPAGTYTISYTNYSSSGNIKFRISGIGGVQPGDTFDSPINIGTFNKNFTYSDTRNTEYYKNSFEGKTTNDIFYKIVLTVPTDIKIKYSGEVIKAFYSILSSSGTLLSSQMISGVTYYSLENMQPGTYYIVAEGYKLNGSITTTVEGVSKVNGNTFSSPIEAGIFDNNFVYTDTKNTADFTDNFKGMPTKDVFYRFSIGKPMDLNISHCGSVLSDTYLHLLSSSGDIIAFNDNYTGTGQCSNTNLANLRLQKLAAGTYYIVSEGKTTDGSITTKIEGISSPSYANIVVPISKNSNYIATITPLDATKQAGLNNGEIKVDNNARTNISIEYYDGLGRPIQTVQRGLTPSGKDLVSIQEYDNFGRKSNTWLPGTSSANGAYNDPETIKNATVNLNGSDTRPYTANIYEQASTGRLLDNYGPGIDWYNNGRSVNSSYKINVTNSTGCDPKLVCALYQVVETVKLKKVKDYEGGTLYVTQLTDENGNLTYEFKNKQEQLILTRQIENNIRYDTYYVYDDYGNLCFVLPPLAADALTAVNTTWSEETIAIKDYAYVYRYDYKDRCILKKLPGCEPIYYVYDKADQPIFTQDGEQRKKGEWAFTIPDALGRTVLTGICKNTLNYTADPLKAIVLKAVWGKVTNTYKGYTITGISLTTPTILSASYYDNYEFMGLNSIPANTDVNFKYNAESGYGTWYGVDYIDANKHKNKGLLTGTLTAQMKSDGSVDPIYLYSVMYYDNRGRLIQTKSNNHLTGGIEKEYIAYNFTGQPTQRKHIHQATGKNTQTELYTYTYDHAGRLLKTTHQLTDGTTVKPQVTLAENTYDDLGRLKTNKKGGQANLTSTYAYNVRSWTKSITSPLFNQTLYYNDKVTAHTYSDYQQMYNGNISGMEWQLKDESKRSYRFKYDNLSRLTHAAYNGVTNGGMYNVAYAYDKHGNMSSLTRRGKSSAAADNNALVDQLSITYAGNQMIHVSDAVANFAYAESADFKDKVSASGTIEYTYNANGAMNKDLNKGITEIQYNSLNLPRQMIINSSSVKAKNYYTYSASGVKLKTEQRYDPNYTVTPSNATNPTNDGLADYKNTDYAGNIIYETVKSGSTITNRTRILVDGGYYEGGVYYYYLADHLGNNRVVVNQSGTVAQKNHYYPFGTAFADKYDNGTNQPYKYNGKELDQMHQLNLYDYSARYYESALGRFTSVDPLAEKYYSISPYAYCYNNPLRFIDPDGKAPMGGAGGGGPIILGGPAFWTHRSKIGNALASIIGMKDLFTLTTALLEPISGKPAATFDFTDNGIEFTPVSANDVENSKNAILIPAVSGKGLGKAGQIADDIAGAAAKTNNAIVSHAGKEVPVFRGGNSLMVKPNEIKIKDGLVQPTHGVSVNVNSADVAKFGGAYEVKNLPSGLKMLQRGKDVGHFEIVPTKAIPIEDYQKLLNQIELSPVK